MMPLRESVLGIKISLVNMSLALTQLDEWVLKRSSNYVCVTPAHAVMECYKHPELRHIFNASQMTTPDGMAIVWLLRLKGHRQVERVYGPDLMLELCHAGLNKGYRHFFYGGAPGVVEELSSKLKLRFPGLQVAGTLTPPFRPMTVEEDYLGIEKINASNPDILWIGLSSPKQEIWMHDHLDKISAPVMLGVGAAFDFLSGTKPQAPYWLQRSGLEWLFRLLCEPRRLWPRYRQYPLFVLLVLGEYLGIHKVEKSTT
jgi:N-acetylglucosaminyldiphosphoundecaprenol N-acetyl-beta-D-mannosaminyltransferase